MTPSETMAPDDTATGRAGLSRRLRAHQGGALVLGAAGLVLGLLMVPRGDELLVMRVKGRNLAEAQRLLTNEAGLSSRASVVAHGEVFLQLGDVDSALSRLEGYVKTMPDDADAWQRLAAYYRQAQRLHDYVRALEHLQRLRPSAELSRELVARYLWLGDERRELASLRALVDSGDADETEHLRAARLAAGVGDLGAAATVFHRLAQRQPDAFDIEAVNLWASLLVDLGRAPQVPGLLGQLPVVRSDAALLSGLAALLRQQGAPEAALALLDEPALEIDEDALRLARLQSEMGSGQTAQAFDEARALLLEGKLPPEGRVLLVESALAQGAIEEAWTAAELMGVSQVPRWLRARFVTLEWERGHVDAALAALERVGEESVADSPLLAAELALARRDPLRARYWLDAFDGASSDDVAQRVQAALLERRAERPDRAFERLSALVPDLVANAAPDVASWGLASFVDLARETGRLDEAVGTLEANDLSTSDAGRIAWVRAVARERPERLADWLASTPEVSAPLLEELYYLRIDAGDAAGALDLAERLYATEPTPRHALHLGRVLSALGDHERSLAPLRLAGTEAGAAELLDAALVLAQRAGHEHAEEIRTRFAPQLASASSDVVRLEFLVEGLLAAGGASDAWPYLPALARHAPERWTATYKEASVALGRVAEFHTFVLGEAAATGLPAERLAAFGHLLVETNAPDADLAPVLERLAALDRAWIFPYDEALARLGDRGRQVALWAREAGSESRTTEERRAAAFRLSALGAKAAAITAFRALASEDAADPLVGQLLFLWGPRPPGDAIDWLAARLATAPVGQRAGWMTHMTTVGAGAGVLDVMPLWPVDAAEDERVAWLAAARQASAREAIAEGLMRDLLTYPDPERARFVGKTALEEGLPTLALSAWGVVAGARPADTDANHWAGTLAFYEGDLELSEPYLRRYVSAGGREPEPLYQFAEIRRAAGDGSSAGYYQQVVAAIEAMRAPTFFLTTLRANALSRLGERARASEAFEALLASDPQADDVRADYAALLMEWGDLARAKDVLVIR